MREDFPQQTNACRKPFTYAQQKPVINKKLLNASSVINKKLLNASSKRNETCIIE